MNKYIHSIKLEGWLGTFPISKVKVIHKICMPEVYEVPKKLDIPDKCFEMFCQHTPGNLSWEQASMNMDYQMHHPNFAYGTDIIYFYYHTNDPIRYWRVFMQSPDEQTLLNRFEKLLVLI